MQNRSDPSLSVRFSSALALHQNGDLDGAAALYRQILAGAHDHDETLHHLGLVALQRGDIGAAIRLIEKSIGSNPRQPNAHSNLGHCLTLAG